MTSAATIACHSGSFHADDAVGIAVLMSLHPDASLVRTRNQDLVSGADFAVDVGGQWDPSRGLFDHHQRGFDGRRADGTLYASAGLVWSAHGRDFVAALAGAAADAATVRQVADEIDDEFIIHVDRADTGEAHGAPGTFGYSAMVAQFNATWLEGADAGDRAKAEDASFMEVVRFTQQLLQRMVHRKLARLAAVSKVRASRRLEGGRLLVLDQGMPWQETVLREMPDVLFVLFLDDGTNHWVVRTVPVESGSFDAKLDLPAAWAGLRDQELAAASGVADARFVHNNLFIGGAYSFDGALNMARAALEGAPAAAAVQKA